MEQYLGENNYYIFYYSFRILFVHIGPCVSLVLLNMLLFRALHQTQKTRQRLFDYNTRTSMNMTPNNNSFANYNPRTTTVSFSNNESRRSTLVNPNIEPIKESYMVLNSREEMSTYQMPPKQPEMSENYLFVDKSAIGSLSYTAPGQSSSSTTVTRRDSNSTTIMLIVIVSMFLLLEIPITFTTILHLIQNTFLITIVDYNILNTIILITNFFIILSYPINFAIYCGMSRLFRQTFNQMFIARFGRKWSQKCGNSATANKHKRTNRTHRGGGSRDLMANKWGLTYSWCMSKGEEIGAEEEDAAVAFDDDGVEQTNAITSASSTTFGVTRYTDPPVLTVSPVAINSTAINNNHTSHSNNSSCDQSLKSQLDLEQNQELDAEKRIILETKL